MAKQRSLRDARPNRLEALRAPYGAAAARRPARALEGRGDEAVPWIAEIQRGRILDAAVAVLAELGVASMSVAHVVERSGVSRRAFYELFSNRADCVVAAFERALADVSARVLSAYEAKSGWRERVRAGLVALLGFLDEEPSVARLLIVDSYRAGAAVLERRSEVLATLARAVDEGRTEGNASVAPSALTAEGVVGGALSIVQARLPDADAQPLLGLTSSLMSMIVLPYLGSAAARREARRPAPASPANERAARDDGAIALHDLGMRLTYRTLRVLVAVAEHPGGSNRLIGATAGIDDQGQISKLLARLRRSGLIANTGALPSKGAPNSWTLTPAGSQLVARVRAHTEGRRRGSYAR